MKQKIALIAVLFLVFASAAFALSDPLGGGKSYQITCGTTARNLAPSGTVSYQAFRFFVNSATTVHVGGPDVAGSSTGMPYCTNSTNCVASTDSVDGNPAGFFCRASSDVTVTVFAGKR
jgi:hypothetical protein